MKPLTPNRLYMLSLAAGLVITVAAGMVVRDQGTLWGDVAAGVEDELIFVLNPADCKLDQSDLAAIQDLADEGTLPVRVIFVNGPADLAMRAEIADAFGLALPVAWDEGDWEQLLRELHMPRGTVIRTAAGRPTGLRMPADWESLVGDVRTASDD